jgi:exopolyphosphatase / guanosine-5'-triphosphate,3'-diphosphate pyrophosphatase
VARAKPEPVIAAIDVGTNAVRLELAKPMADGTYETLHQERDPVRPGEGVFATGSIPKDVGNRLVATLRRYGALCRRHKARVRAVATSALREARNRDEIVRRVRTEAGLLLEVVSGKEEARLICMGVLFGKPANERSLIIDIGGGSTEVATAVGEEPNNLWSVALGAVRVTEVFNASGKINAKQLKLMRHFCQDAVGEALPAKATLGARTAIGSSGTINALVIYAAAEGTGHADLEHITETVDELVEMGPEGRRKQFDARRADIVVSGACILEAVMKHLGVRSITRTDRGLRDGLLVDLMRRGHGDFGTLTETAVALGRRFYFSEDHARQVSRLALALFDDLAALHRLPAAARPLLEVAALLHDIGHAVSYQRHHKHTAYLIQNADIPGLTDRERFLAAMIARYHRRTPPEAGHWQLAEVTPGELTLVRKASTLLRIADSLDRSHHQPVKAVHASASRTAVNVRVVSKQPVDLELWDAQHETALFRSVFARRLDMVVTRS